MIDRLRRSVIFCGAASYFCSQATAAQRFAGKRSMDGTNDDTSELIAAHTTAMLNQKPLVLESRTYVIDGWSEVLSGDVAWIGTGETIVAVKKQSIDFKVQSFRSQLVSDIRVGEEEIWLAGPPIAPGSIISLHQSAIADAHRPEDVIAQCFTVLSFDNGKTKLDYPSRFTFARSFGVIVEVFEKATLAYFRGIKFKTFDGNSHNRSLTLTGFRHQNVVGDCTFSPVEYRDVNVGVDGLLIQNSINVRCRNITFDGCRYGLMISRGSRAVNARGIYATANRHAIYPAYCSYKCHFEHIHGSGNRGTIDCHSSFNISYSDILCQDEVELSNGRSSGFSLRNASFSVRKSAALKRFIVSPQVWTPKFTYLSSAEQVTLKNIHINFDGMPPADRVAISIGETGPITISEVFCSTPGLIVEVESGAKRHIQLSNTNLSVRSRDVGHSD